jgi:class 3 adenylate cyclase
VQSTGDGVFALFGGQLRTRIIPNESIYAALRMQEDIRRYAEQLRREGKPPLQVRVGANTGEPVVWWINTGEARADRPFDPSRRADSDACAERIDFSCRDN